MTREELHELVDIVMDAREKGHSLRLEIGADIYFWHIKGEYYFDVDYKYPTFSDFTQAVKDYIKSLER